MIKFKEWLREKEENKCETTASTADVAGFARPIGIGSEEPEEKKKKDDKKMSKLPPA